mmetsp:Transcript_41944/g.64227  ORF Transcript_41944/g.64227 Transcript_41944/m.64227 type:complete len:104 (+) Transcript_41944:333-644(+)
MIVQAVRHSEQTFRYPKDQGRNQLYNFTQSKIEKSQISAGALKNVTIHRASDASSKKPTHSQNRRAYQKKTQDMYSREVTQRPSKTNLGRTDRFKMETLGFPS